MQSGDEDQIRQLERLCVALYEGPPAEQKEAHDFLLPLTQDAQNIARLQAVVSQSTDVHALVFAANSLIKLFTSHWNAIPNEQKTSTRKFILNYLFQRGPSMVTSAPVCLQVFIRLLVRVTKLSWLENVENQNIVQQVNQFLSASTAHWVVGLSIYSEITSDMTLSGGPSVTRQRRTALAFKDSALPKIAQVGVQTLKNLNLGTMSITNTDEEHKLLHQVLQMVNDCFSYDFMGIMPDETSEEQSTVMVPLSWDFLHSSDICNTLFELYRKSWSVSPPWTDCARLCLQNLVLFASFRKTFFNKEGERLKQLSQLVAGTASILENQIGLEQEECFHELCRLLGKINAANQFADLASSPKFTTWLEEAYQFTIKSLQNWAHLPNSKHYLLGLWSGMYSPGRRKNSQVEDYIEQVTLAYIQSRMCIAEAVANDQDSDDFEDPLTNEVMRSEQLESLSFLGRCRYTQTAKRVAELFDSVNVDGQNGVIPLKVYRQKTIWLVYMIGALVGGHMTVVSANSSLTGGPGGGNAASPDSMSLDIDDDELWRTSPEAAHCELSSRVFRLMMGTDAMTEAWSEQLELAYLYFLEEFRKFMLFGPPRLTVFTRQAMGAEDSSEEEKTQNRAAARLAKSLNLNSADDVGGLVVRKAIFNLKYRSEHESVLKQSLHLLVVICSSSNWQQGSDKSPHQLLKDEAVLRLMLDHRDAQFAAFLMNPRYFKYRTQYYGFLTRLLLMELRAVAQQQVRTAATGAVGVNESPLSNPKFYDFMSPFGQTFAQFGYPPQRAEHASALAELPRLSLIDPSSKPILIGLCRDLRGIVMTCHSADSYILFFNWLVNNTKNLNQSRVRLFGEVAQVWAEDSEVMVPLLKFGAEMVNNKASRIHFDAASASGLILFKEVSKILIAYGSRILQKSFQDNSRELLASGSMSAMLYKQKYKGIAVALEMFGNVLAGDYTNFGVFELYDDTALSNSLSLALQMCLAIPNEDLQAYLKSLKSFFTFLEVVTKNFMPQIMTLHSQQLATIVKCLDDGVCAFDTGVSMQCCTALDHLVKYLFEKREDQTDEGEAVRKFMAEQPEALRRVLQVVFQLLMSGEVASTWFLSRPMLGLILMHESEFIAIRDHFTQNPQFDSEKQQKLTKFFDDLMEGVSFDLSSKNKEKFTQNLFSFTHNLRMSMT